jgi:DinB superfamily
MSKQALLDQLKQIDRRRLRLLDEVDQLEGTVVTKKPAPEKWSIAEIVEHLVLAERDVLGGLRATTELQPHPRTVQNHVAYHVVMFVLRFGIPVKAPSTAMLPTGSVPLAEARRLWNENHEWLRGYVTELDSADLAPAVFHHPVAGPLTVAQAVRMLGVHLVRHARQIDRLRGPT